MNRQYFLKLKVFNILIAFIIIGLFFRHIFIIPIMDLDMYSLNPFLECIVFLGWGASINNRIAHRDARRLLTLMAMCMVLLIAVRIIKYSAVESVIVLRYMWYFYYCPLTLIAALSFRTSLYLANSRIEKIIKKIAYFIWITTFLLILGIITNDIHQWAYRFTIDLEHLEDYTHGFLYWLCIIWIVGLCLASLLMIVIRSRIRLRRIQFFYILIGPLFFIGWMIIWSYFGNNIYYLYRFQDIFCYLFIFVWEGCIITGLIPTNADYLSYFEESHISAEILDASGTKVIRSKRNEERKYYDADNLVFHRKPIYGGFVSWVEDITRLNELNRELADLKMRLSEKVILLDAENQMREEKSYLETQNKIYEEIRYVVKDQMSFLQKLIADTESDYALFDQNMAKACILTAYIKRRINMTLKADQEEIFSLHMLYIAIRESLDYLRKNHIPAYCSMNEEKAFSTKIILLAYDNFEKILEMSLDQMKGMIVYLDAREDGFELQISIEGVTTIDIPDQDVFDIQASLQDDTVYYRLVYKREGENNA